MSAGKASAERIDADFGAADLGDGRGAEAAEDVADPPDREADRDQAQDHAHNDAADPIGGRFLNTSKHETVSCCLGERPRFKADWPEYRGRCTAPQLTPNGSGAGSGALLTAV